MNVSKFLNIAVTEKVADLSITGDIGYNEWADTFEDYKKNTSENIKNELEAIRNLKAETINVTLESLGGDLSHALSIYSLLKNSGATINTYYRGANASSSTIIGSAASSVENIFMDSTGLYLIHKPMTGSAGNSNDLQKTINDLDKWQNALEQSYLALGVTQDTLDELMAKNNGHGEWLSFSEAKEYGFVGQEWITEKVSNYTKATFENKNILIPNNLINQSPKKIIMNDEVKKSLFVDFKNWFKNETEEQAKAESDEKFLNDLKEENEALKTELENLTKDVEETTEEIVNEPVVETEVVAEEVVAEPEVSVDELIANKVSEALKGFIEPTKTKESNPTNKKVSVWEQHLQNFQNFK